MWSPHVCHNTLTLCFFLYRLSLCEKALAEYLDTKRLAFPRFYFISSADLLDILSNGTNPHQVASLTFCWRCNNDSLASLGHCAGLSAFLLFAHAVPSTSTQGQSWS